MKKLSAIVNVTAKMPICVVMNNITSISIKKILITRIITTARTRTIRGSTIANPSFFFEINGNREVF